MELSLEQVAERLSGQDDARTSYGASRLGLVPPETAEDDSNGATQRQPLPPLLQPPPRRIAPVDEPEQSVEQPTGESKSSRPLPERTPIPRRNRTPKWEGPFRKRSFKLPAYLAMRLRIESHRQDRYIWDLAAEAIAQYLDDKQTPS